MLAAGIWMAQGSGLVELVPWEIPPSSPVCTIGGTSCDPQELPGIGIRFRQKAIRIAIKSNFLRKIKSALWIGPYQ
jgi:hypothetical protein